MHKEMVEKNKKFAEFRESATEFFFPRIYKSKIYQDYLSNNYARHNRKINDANIELLEAQIANRH